jgi:hypothetical protein
MVAYKNIRVKMRGGGSRIQRAMVLASGKLKFVKNVHRSSSKSRAAKPMTHRTKRRNLNMARKRHSRGGGGSNLLGSVEKVSKAGVLLAPTIRALLMPNDKLGHFVLFNSGVNIRSGRFDTAAAASSAIPIVGVFLGWKAFHKLNAIIRRI